MPRHPGPAHSYDEIVRQTVPELDSSLRPSREQEKAAYEGTRILDEDEQRLYARVVDALLGLTDVDPSGITVEIDRDTVKLHGRVGFAGALDRIERRVEDVEGVGAVVNYLVIGSA
jgi:osmotically-inducible protein OsmY